MNRILLLMCFCTCVYQLFSQTITSSYDSSLILRSTYTIASPSSFNSNGMIQQSIGQASIIGTYNSEDYSLGQGFIEANSWMMQMLDLEEDVIDLQLHPNPFTDFCDLYGINNSI